MLSSKISDFAKKQDDLNGTKNDMARTLASSADSLKDLIADVKNATLEYEQLNSSTKDLFDEFKNVDKALQDAFKSIEGALQNYTDNTQKTVSEYMDKFQTGTQNYTNTFMSSVNEVKLIDQEIKQTLKDIFDIQKQIRNLPDSLKKALSDILNPKEKN